MNGRVDLLRCYRLFSRIERGVLILAQIFKFFLSRVGSRLADEVVEKKNLPEDHWAMRGGGGGLVSLYISMHVVFRECVETTFCSDSIFHKALREGRSYIYSTIYSSIYHILYHIL